jgi:hypothetical protein
MDPCPIGEFGLSIMDPKAMSWTHVGRAAFGGATPFVIRVPR